MKHSFYACVGMALLYSCSAGYTSLPIDEGVTLNVTSRADPQPLTNGSVGIFLRGANYASVNNLEYKYGDGKWTTASPINLIAPEANVCAYYPYDAALSANADLIQPFALTTQEYTDGLAASIAADLLYSINRAVSGYFPKLSLDFVHAYSQLELRITNENYEGAMLSSIQFNQLPSTGTVDIQDGKGTVEKIGKYPLRVDPAIEIVGVFTRKVLIVPTQEAFTVPLTLSLTVNHQVLTVTIPLTELSAYRSGQKNVIKLKIKGKAVELEGGITAEPWDDSEVNSGKDYIPV